MVINHNMAAENSYRQLGVNQSAQSSSMEKLSSGLRINRAGDDAAGLSISEKMRGQISGLEQASRNADDGISLIQTAEGALNETESILQRMRELGVQASNDTNVTADRDAIQSEIDALVEEIDNIANTTQFNTQNLLSGGFSGKTFMIGANEGETLTLSITSMTAGALGISALAVSATTNAQSAVTLIDSAITAVSKQRSSLGAVQNRLEHTINNVDNAAENLTAAESAIRDTDMAEEMMEYTRTDILAQAAQSMLAQANQSPQNVLSLLQ